MDMILHDSPYNLWLTFARHCGDQQSVLPPRRVPPPRRRRARCGRPAPPGQPSVGHSDMTSNNPRLFGLNSLYTG